MNNDKNISDKFIRTSIDNFENNVKVIDVVYKLKPGDIVTGLNFFDEYFQLLKLSGKEYSCTLYGKPLKMCILGSNR